MSVGHLAASGAAAPATEPVNLVAAHQQPTRIRAQRIRAFHKEPAQHVEIVLRERRLIQTQRAQEVLGRLLTLRHVNARHA
ncbi:hypothetical protein GCM10025876_08300 [Demequina litorisediminis]|uniref:Uncharacterized protein n=1 Tax=Demequina litorisediminis TaxID=1849022 RepID=A0ABQ6IAZ4_9MICO|nr:hypothetical protein GCM10025876_08300 [Demequina litorisediminis]